MSVSNVSAMMTCGRRSHCNRPCHGLATARAGAPRGGRHVCERSRPAATRLVRLLRQVQRHTGADRRAQDQAHGQSERRQPPAARRPSFRRRQAVSRRGAAVQLGLEQPKQPAIQRARVVMAQARLCGGDVSPEDRPQALQYIPKRSRRSPQSA